jgi:membrane-associated protease RseP (regulator of RpoE activity)
MSEPTPSITSSTLEYYRPMPVRVPTRPRPRYWLHALLLLATCFTTLVVGARLEFNFLHYRALFVAGDESIPFFAVGWVIAQPSRLLLGIPFSASLLLILLTHEMGHYLCCLYYGVNATLPFFIPAPTLIGTLGAVIRIKSPIRSRAALFDIGIAGPIAGFIAAVITLAISLLLSRPMVPSMGRSDLQMGYPLILKWMHYLLGIVVPHYAIAGLPISRIYLHPTAVAALVGMFATALNLLPSGQLDGGHIVYALWPRAHRFFSWITIVVLVALGQLYVGWRVWAALLIVMNVATWRQRQAPEYPELPAARWPLAFMGLVMLLLTFTVAPFQLIWK